MKPLFEIFDAENEKFLASQEIKKNLHKIDAEGASVVAQLSSGDVKGNNFRALRQGDTELVVGVYSVNEKGNLAVLTGLGKEPVAVISTIFNIVKTCVTKNKAIETIVFRLNKRALKGKEKLIQRIIQKLVKARFGSRFEIKDEFIDVSPAMSFIVAQKHNADELDPEDFVERQEKVKDQMVVKQLAIDFDKPEGDAIESELTSYKGTTISYSENYTIINFNKNYNSEIFQDAAGKLKAKNPGLKFEYNQNSLTVDARLSREQTIEVCEAVFESDKENFNRLLKLKSKPNFGQGNDRPNKKQNIKLARKLALDEIKSYANANKLKKATLSKYKYIDTLGAHYRKTNSQVLIRTTLASGTTIPEYRDNEKCSGWIAAEANRKINSDTITAVASDIKYRLQQEGFNVSMASQNWTRYLESDGFVIIVALEFPQKSDRFKTSGYTSVDMISAYLYNKSENKTYLLSDSAGAASVDGQDINKTIADLVKSKTVNVDKLPDEDFIAKEPEPKVDLKSSLEKTLKLAKNYDFSADSNDIKFIDRLAKLTDIKEVSKELEKYLKAAGNKHNAATFIENVLEQVLLSLPQKDSLPEADKTIVSRYTNEQNAINKYLRSGEELNKNQQKFVDDLSRSIVKNSQNFDLVYRVIRDIKAYDVQDWLETRIIKDKAFVSTSLVPTQFLANYRAENAAGRQKGSVEKNLEAAIMNDKPFDIVLRIQDAKGVLVGDASVHKKEAEVLLNKGAKFKIESVDKVIPDMVKNVIELTVTHLNSTVKMSESKTLFDIAKMILEQK